MSAHSTSPREPQAAADQPKDRSGSLPRTQPTSQDVNHSDPAATVTPATAATTQSPGERDSVTQESSAEPAQSPQPRTSQESGEASPVESAPSDPSAPPLPNEPPPSATTTTTTEEDDGWDFHWDATNQAYFFYNRFTGESTWENPRAGQASSSSNGGPAAQPPLPPSGVAEPPKNERPPAGGYNPAIHGDYDPEAWYAKSGEDGDIGGGEVMLSQDQAAADPAAYAAMGSFNRFTGRWQGEGAAAERHNDEAKSRRQMNAFFDVDAAANSHDGRSLKAERAGKKPTKAELRQFKEKRRAKKEEKRRAWLRD
ncbi:hypothetical protein GGR52DRAFT_531484 [Hypoxylon sp. FL1284]|nr:hypothetical protein GGR52DRAFT_531484 [Hypoxylon sp. FL1284]